MVAYTHKIHKAPRAGLTPAELTYIPKLDESYQFDMILHEEITGDIIERIPVILIGHMGTGKSTTFQQIAASLSKPFRRVGLNQQCTVSDLVGYNTVINGNIVWIDGVLTASVRNGYWINLDEIDAADPAVLFVLNNLAEEGGTLTLKEKDGEVLIPHEHFRLFGTANTIGKMEDFRHVYQGTNQMNAAFIDRWRVYYQDYMTPELEMKVLVAKTGCDIEGAETLVNIATEVREAFNNNELDKSFSTRALIDLTRFMKRVLDREDALPTAQRKNASEIITYSVDTVLYPKLSRRDCEYYKQVMARVIGEID